MLVRRSCTIRKMAVSHSEESRPKSASSARLTLILLRSPNPSTYQRTAEGRPASSSNGGGRRGGKKRRSPYSGFPHSQLSPPVLSGCGVTWFAFLFIVGRVIITATKVLSPP